MIDLLLNTEPVVIADRDREAVTFAAQLGLAEALGVPLATPLYHASPVSADDCAPALEWAERMEAALDNFVSEVRLIQDRMDRTRARANWHDGLRLVLPGEAGAELGAGASVEAYRG